MRRESPVERRLSAGTATPGTGIVAPREQNGFVLPNPPRDMRSFATDIGLARIRRRGAVRRRTSPRRTR